MKLNTIDIKLKKSKKRVARGIGSGKGKTAGRGHKGQKSRSGVAIKSFEGGQMPLYRRLPKRGFRSFRKNKLISINLSQIQKFLDDKKILSKDLVDLSNLKKTNLINKKYNLIKILGMGEIKDKIETKVNFISHSAKNKIEKSGGKVVLINNKNLNN